MKLYVANGTRQRHSFTYQMKNNSSPRIQPIEIGGQILVSGKEMTKEDVDSIVNHHAEYGLIPVEEVDNLRGPFAGLCYSIDRPIDPAYIERAMSRRVESLKDQGERLRKEAALAANSYLEEEAERVDHSKIGNLEMSIQEEDRPDRSANEDLISEGIRVSRDEGESSGRRRNRGRR